MVGTLYPSSIDGYSQLPLVVDLVSPVRADDVNRIRNAVVAIENELGINPSDIYGTVKDRIDAIVLGDSSAPTTAQYVTLATNATLTAERVLTGTSGEISFADGGAGGNITASLVATGISPGSYSAPNLTVDAKGRLSAASNNNFANTSLSNLSSTTINTSLIPAINDGYSVGSASFIFHDGYFYYIAAGTGSSAAASYTFLLDTDTGLYNPSSNNLGITVGGSQRANFNSTGQQNIVDVDGYSIPLILRNTNTTADAFASTGIEFRMATTSGADVAAAQIMAGKEATWTTTLSTQDGYISFLTASDNILSERARITSAGALGLGTTSPTGVAEFRKNQNAPTNLSVSNSTSNTAARAAVLISVDSVPAIGGNCLSIIHNSPAFTSAGIDIARASVIYGTDAGGAVVGTRFSDLVFGTGIQSAAASERMRVKSTGQIAFLKSGNTSVPQLEIDNLDVTSSSLAGSGLNFRLADTSGNTISTAQVLAGKEQTFTTTASTQDGYLGINVVENGVLEEKARINSAGQFIITNLGVAGAPALSFQNSALGFFRSGNELQYCVGTTVPLKLQAATTVARASSTAASRPLIVENPTNTSDALAAVKLGFQLTTNSSTSVVAAEIGAGKEQTFTSTTSTQDGYLAFFTSSNGLLSEWARITSDGYFGVGETPVAAQTSINQTSASKNIPVLRLTQAATDEEFIDFVGTSGAAKATSISTEPAGNTSASTVAAPHSADWTLDGMVEITINGVVKYIPFYS